MRCIELNKIGNFETWESTKIKELKAREIPENLGQKLLFENDSMLIWEVLLSPNERLPFRKIKRDYCWVSMCDAVAITRNQNGKISLLRFNKGDSAFLNFYNNEQIYDLENIGENLLHFHIMEFKAILEPLDKKLDNQG